MYILECWIEHPVRTLDHTFTYLSDVQVSPGCRVSVDFNHHELVGFVETVEESNLSKAEIEKQRGMEIRMVNAVIDEEPLITNELHDLALMMKKTTLSTTISCFQCILPPKIRPSSSAKHIVMERYVRISENEVNLTPKQLQAYMLVKEKGEMRYGDLRKAYPTLAKKMVDSGALVAFEKEKELSQSEVTIQAGNYRFRMSQEDFGIWIDKLKQEVGFDKEAVIAEIRRRLAI